MKDIYDVFGTKTTSLDETAQFVGGILGLTFELRSSDYIGGDYYVHGGLSTRTVMVIANEPIDDDPEDLPYEQFAEYPVVVEVNESPYADEYRDKLVAAGFVHLSRDELETEDE